MAGEFFPTRIPHPNVGPIALRWAWVSQAQVPATNLAPVTNQEFVFPAQVPNPRVGPMALRRGRNLLQLWDNPRPVSDTNYILPTYPAAGLQIGPMVLRGQRRSLMPGFIRVWTVTGSTKNSSGAALPACTLHFFQTATPFAFVGSATSDGSGVYTFNPPGNDGYSADAYLTGSPDVAGRSINGLTVT